MPAPEDALMATEQSAPSSRRTLRLGLPLTIGLFVAAGVVSYYGIRGNAPETPSSAEPAPPPAPGPVATIVLPYVETDLPTGPHRGDFQIACSTCHSTRLALTQPNFPKAKWNEVVHKMVAVYGAPLTPADEAHAADYLYAVRGK
jgi:hypothetical protein